MGTRQSTSPDACIGGSDEEVLAQEVLTRQDLAEDVDHGETFQVLGKVLGLRCGASAPVLLDLRLSVLDGVLSLERGFGNVIQRLDEFLDVGVGEDDAADVLASDTVASAELLHVDALCVRIEELENRS